MWMLVSGYLVLELSGSIIQTQLVGVAYFAPMLLGGLVSGALVDSYDRKPLMILSHLWNLSVVTVCFLLVYSGNIESWQVIVLTFFFGMAGTLDITARRTLAYDLVGSDLIATAISLEYLSATSALILGPTIGGILLDLSIIGGTANAGGAYLTIIFFFLISIMFLLKVRVPKKTRGPSSPENIWRSLINGLKVVAANKAILGLLGITVIINISFFPYLPLIPVFAEQVLEVGPVAMGILGSSQGFGSLLGAFYLVTRTRISRKYPYYIGGAFLSLLGLLLFSLSSVFVISALSLVIAGIGVAGFATMQATLVLLLADENSRGRAIGMLNMAIGVLPLSMFGLGALAQLIGPGVAVTLVTSAGLIFVISWYKVAVQLRQY
jgi:MFS family permease